MSTIQSNSLIHDVDKIATAIRNVFAVEGDLPESDVEKLHLELVRYIEEANARLTQCDELLRRGLRQEAVQECNEEPNLLDLVTRLDFPEWDAWADYVTQFGLPPQPRLLSDVAAELNEAYSKAQSLEGLLRMHRLHSLARSPLPVRIGVLRHIAAKDPKNPAWQTDLESYESARLKQLRTEFSEECKRDNLHAVAALRRELDEAAWRVSPPAGLLEEVADGHRRLVAKSARERLTALEPVINAAFSAFDLTTALAARSQWDQLWPIAGLPSDGDLANRVRPALEWLDEEIAQEASQAEYDRDVASLEDALNDAGATRHQLTRLYAAVERHEEPLQPRVQRRYDERLRNLELAEGRKHRLMLLSGFASVIVVAAVIGIVAFRKTRNSETAATAEAIAKFLTEKQPEQALEYYESRVAAKPYLATSPKIQALRADIETQTDEELARRDRLKSFLEDAEHLVTTPTWESVSAAVEKIKKAEELTRGEGEQVQVLTTERIVADVEAKLQQQVDDEFKKTAAAMMAAVQANGSVPSEKVESQLTDARELLTRKHVSATTRQASGVDLLVRKLETQSASMAQDQRRDESFRTVVNAIGSESAYTRALNGYLIEDATSARATDFREVLAEDMANLGRLTDWNKLAAQWNALSLQSPTDAMRALELIASMQKDLPYFPGVATANELKAYLESVKARQKADGSTLLGEFRNVLKDDMFTMKQMKVPHGEGYFYFLANIVKSGGVVSVSVVEDSSEPTKGTPKNFSIADFDAANPPTISLDTPQKAFAEKANVALGEPDKTYEYVVCKILHLLLTDAQMDPILKCRLLQVFYDRSVPGSSIFSEELRGFRAGLESKYPLEDVNYLLYPPLKANDPRTEDAAKAATIRASTVELLKHLPLLKDRNGTPSIASVYIQRIEPRVKKTIGDAAHLPYVHWLGGLFKNPAGQWTIRAPDTASRNQSGKLVAIVPTENSVPSFKDVGTATGNSLQLDQSASATFREGRPVLLLNSDP